jgi:hypothetical protein
VSVAEESWAERRRRAVQAHAAEHARRRHAEAEQARALLARFVQDARAAGLPAQRLRARAAAGRTTYRTRLHGWYLRPDRSVAVGTDGEFYVLVVPASLRARLFGASVTPEAPRMILGEGGRDGESIPLEAVLRQRLTTGPDGP